MEVEMSAFELSSCPGKYCGRTFLPLGNLSLCGQCPRGTRADDENSICRPCLGEPLFYDWLYLGFMVLLSLVSHWVTMDFCIRPKHVSFNRDVLIMYGVAFLETLGAVVTTLLVSEPIGKIAINSCPVRQLADWYTLFHNPNVDYEHTLHCTQEAVYPLYTIVFIFYAQSLLLMLLFRPALLHLRFKSLSGASTAVYVAMYFLPLYIFLQAVIGGLLYYSFPYIIIVLALVSNAVHFSCKLDQSMHYLVKSSATNLRNVLIIGGNMCFLAYGIVSLTLLENPVIYGPLLGLVPLPTIFYILTARFTEPGKLNVD